MMRARRTHFGALTRLDPEAARRKQQACGQRIQKSARIAGDLANIEKRFRAGTDRVRAVFDLLPGS